MNTRPATPRDSSILSRLNLDVQRLHAQNHPEIFKTPENEDFAVSFFTEVLADPMVTVFIAEQDGNAVGYVVCRLVERPETPFTFPVRYLLVDQISVRLEARRKGAGEALLQQAEALARQLDVKRLQLDSYEFNHGAHTFFKRMGFRRLSFRFWKLL